MNLSELFIRRPVMTTLVMLGILIFDLMSYVLLPISALPNVEYPFINVSASLPGGTPETMASYLLGYSLNNLSLMALTLSVGFVVDDAIMVLENIVRHRERGEAPLEAALKGSQEVSFTIVSMTLSLVAVFIPIIFMGGLIGRLFHEFAITISSAILISGFVSLSLTPMLCSRFLRSSHQERQNWLYRLSEKAFALLLRGYEWTLKLVLQYRRMTLIGSGILLLLTFYLFTIVPKGFIPTEDTGLLTANTKAAQDISLFPEFKPFFALPPPFPSAGNKQILNINLRCRA